MTEGTEGLFQKQSDVTCRHENQQMEGGKGRIEAARTGKNREWVQIVYIIYSRH
jgi:hypothetical protein